MLFFLQTGESEACDRELLLSIIGYCVVIPLGITVISLYLLLKFKRNQEPYFNRLFFFVGLAVVWSCVNFVSELSILQKSVLYFMLFVAYLLNQRRRFNLSSLFVTFLLAYPFVFGFIYGNGGDSLLCSIGSFKETDFYARKFVHLDDLLLDETKRRNVIVVFAESFEKKYASVIDGENHIRVLDEEGVSFSDFTEGYAQRWTQGALFSAFTGTHIHYLSEFFRYSLYDKLKYDDKKDRLLMVSNKIGTDFGFETPNIDYLGDIMAANGYQNIFVQGADAVFSGTRKFLSQHGFENKDIYDLEVFKDYPEYDKSVNWWGVNDQIVFELFKQKISERDKHKSFFAVMFTLDLHRGNNPYYSSVNEIAKATITNLNDFIAWFRQQDFYEDTTLIVLADHKRMGTGIKPGGGLYNTFFNLPESLKKDVNVNRRFNQVDMFPSILEIAGFNLPQQRAGMGVSLFSSHKTIAEEYSYDEQADIFSKIDRFYQRLWGKIDMFSKPFNMSFGNVWLKEKLIAHVGGRLNGVRYTNSVEAAEWSIKRGYKYIELDLLCSKYTWGGIVAAHDWELFKLFFGSDGEKAGVNYHVFDENSILDFFRKHPNVWLVTDKIDNFELLADKLGELQKRMIVEVFSVEKYEEAFRNGFLHIAYNVRNMRDLRIVEKHNYPLITISLSDARRYHAILKKLKSVGVKIMGYSAKNLAEVEAFADVVDVFYYDGEDNLNQF